ncbi:unnamed protein product [Rhizophagus irregularis]|nr:unnamed protein product [Rhizophagus irregularis]CAB4420338.1 unnamed protein product [Rhizophagus irregularis]
MTYVTRLSVRKNKQGKNEINNKNKKSNGKSRNNQKQKRKISTLPPQKPQYVKVYINDILAIKSQDGEEYALLAYSDPNLESDWQPIRNLRNANDLVKDFRSKLTQSQVENSNPNQMIIDEENCRHHSDFSESTKVPIEWKNSFIGIISYF